MSKLKNLWSIILAGLTCFLTFAVFIFFLFQNSNFQKEAKASSYNDQMVIAAVNQERIKFDLPPLIVNEKLSKAAQNKALDMNKNNYFSHVSPVDGKKWSNFIKESGYNYKIAGENLANGFDDVPSMVRSWMKSPSHRENILNPNVSETGVGVVFGKLNNYPTIFVAQSFGEPNEEKERKPEKVENKSETIGKPGENPDKK